MILSQKSIGTKLGQINQVDYDTFSVAISNAESIYTNRETKTQEEIDNAIEVLENARITFENSVVKNEDNRIFVNGSVTFINSSNLNLIVVDSYDRSTYRESRRTVQELRASISAEDSSVKWKVIPHDAVVTNVAEFESVTESLDTDPVLDVNYSSGSKGVVQIVAKSINGKLRSYEVVSR